MSGRPVVLAADDLVPARWAAAEAERLRAPLQVVGTGNDVARTRVTQLLRASAPGAPVASRRVADPLGADLRRVSAGAELMVVSAAVGPRVVGAAVCPVATVPPTVPPLGRVIVAVAPRTAPSVLDLAVHEALARDAELVAVRVRGGPDADPGDALPDVLARWQRDLTHACRDLRQAVARWGADDADRRFRLLTVRGDPVPLLIALGIDAELLVVGCSVHGAGATVLAGELVATVRCPVIGVPDPATPRGAAARQRVRSGS